MDIRDFLDLKAKKEKELQELLKNEGKNMLEQLFRPVLDAGLDIRWEQYTPYFNDGDPCVFRVYGASYRVRDKDKPTEEELDADGDLDEDGFHDSFSYTCEAKYEWHIPGYKAVITKFEKSFNKMDAVFEACFGDGYQVTVTLDKKNKMQITTEECSHE